MILLTETRSVAWLSPALPGYSVAYIPASCDGLAGEGILVAVKRHHGYLVQDWGSDSTCLWVKLVFGDAPPLIVGSCYMPPAGSPLLIDTSLENRFHKLTVDVAGAALEGHVFLGGDFNAHVARTCPVQAGMDRHLNSHGRRLLEVCSTTDSVLCTGLVRGDEGVLPTFHATQRSGATRPDHVLVSASLFGNVYSSTVLTGWRGSDHLPLDTLLRLPIYVGPRLSCDGHRLLRANWDPLCKAHYVAALQGPAMPHLHACLAAAASGDVSSAFNELASCVSVAATASGMPLRPFGGRSGTPRNKPFFDQECRVLKAQVRVSVCREGRSDASRALERQLALSFLGQVQAAGISQTNPPGHPCRTTHEPSRVLAETEG